MSIKRYFISVVSHGHFALITSNNELKKISALPNVFIAIKDNLSDKALENFCYLKGYSYVTTLEPLGFGHNNNTVYDYFKEKFHISVEDYFLVINPDVVISYENFLMLQAVLEQRSDDCIYTVNLFRDNEHQVSEQSLRKFPTLFSSLNMFIFKPVCKEYNKELLTDFDMVEWSSGAFLVFKSSIYEQLAGFDISYFMYYEDVDICLRYYKISGHGICFLKNIHATHIGAYQNRRFFSKHFFWYLRSLARFLKRK